MEFTSSIAVGMTHEVHSEVTEDKTARVVGSGSLDVYATPCMAALMERAVPKRMPRGLDDGRHRALDRASRGHPRRALRSCRRRSHDNQRAQNQSQGHGV